MKKPIKLIYLLLTISLLVAPILSCAKKENEQSNTDESTYDTLIPDIDISSDNLSDTGNDSTPSTNADTDANTSTDSSVDKSTQDSNTDGESTLGTDKPQDSTDQQQGTSATPGTSTKPTTTTRPDTPTVVFPSTEPPSNNDQPSLTRFYVNNANGNDTNDGKSKNSALKTLEEAYKRAEQISDDAACILLCNTYVINSHFTEPAHKKTITLSSDGGTLSFNGAYRFYLSGNTNIKNITIDFKGSVNFVANYNYITFGDNVTLTNKTSGNGAYVVGGYQNVQSGADLTKNSHVRINSGDFYAVIGGSRQSASGVVNVNFTGYQYVEINGGSVKTVYGATTSNHTAKDAYIKINGGYVEHICAAGEMTRSLAGNAVIELNGGKVDTADVNNVLGHAVLKLQGTELRAANVSYYNLDIKADAKAEGYPKILAYKDGLYTEKQLNDLSLNFDSVQTISVYNSETPSASKVIYVSGDGTGNGASPSNPTSLSAALNSLTSGGCIVVVGKTNVPSGITYSSTGKITITSKYGGVDYSKDKGAALVFSSDFSLYGETQFEYLTMISTANYKSIYAKNNRLTIGEGVSCISINKDVTFMSIMGGSQSKYTNAQSNLTIKSGTWQRVRGGTAANGSTGYKVNLTVDGGTFMENLTLGSSLSHTGNINATINGGTFRGGIVASGINSASYVFDSDVTLNINGGVFYQEIAVTESKQGSYNGTFKVTIRGGEFGHLVELAGSEGLTGNMTSTLDSSINLINKQSGTYNFSNPVQDDGADPWIFYNNGYYYYIATAGSVLRLRRAMNIGDLPYAQSKIVYDPEEGKPWSKNLWSPEIHYYSDEQIGAGNGGWYCYIACDNGDNKHHRMYVIKCLDGNDLFGRWGNPITGEVNVPQRIEAKDIEGFDDRWAAGQTDIIINGQLYMMYVTENGRGTIDFYQTINIVKMTNPWTITGQSYPICKSEYDWEMHGHAVSQTTGKIWPKVVEGGTAVYGDNGEVYIIYSGSGYWTTYYALGQLKYMGGDPLDVNNWKKSPEPIFSKNGQINGCGHASYVTDTSGQRWICYHAYTGTNTDSKRDAFIETYTVDANGVTIGNGTKHPADLYTVYTADINPMPLKDRIHGFSSLSY